MTTPSRHERLKATLQQAQHIAFAAGVGGAGITLLFSPAVMKHQISTTVVAGFAWLAGLAYVSASSWIYANTMSPKQTPTCQYHLVWFAYFGVSTAIGAVATGLASAYAQMIGTKTFG
nr:hypothetical protein [Dyella sp. ASV24]